MRRSKRLAGEALPAPQHPAFALGATVECGTSILPGAGRGLFAKQAFQPGDRITYVDGDIVSTRVARTWTPERSSHVRSLSLGHTVIDALREPLDGRGAGSLANDAGYSPGCRYDIRMNNAVFKTEDGTVWLVAVKPIDAGKEVFVSYGTDYWQRRSLE